LVEPRFAGAFLDGFAADFAADLGADLAEDLMGDLTGDLDFFLAGGTRGLDVGDSNEESNGC
jgi:hypothetical protein